MKYPVGVGRTKQDAKQNAAKYALDAIFVKTGEKNKPVSISREMGNVISLKLWCMLLSNDAIFCFILVDANPSPKSKRKQGDPSHQKLNHNHCYRNQHPLLVHFHHLTPVM